LRTIGLIVNPIAGMGGPVGLKGTDSPERLQRAIELGARPRAATRARRAVCELKGADIRLMAAPGAMGSDIAAELGLPAWTIGQPPHGPTAARDTIIAAQELAQQPVDLLLFAGGDGTARDVQTAIGSAVPVLGIPTGVRMHSGVFASSPEAAGRLARRGSNHFTDAEVVDVDGPDAELRVYGHLRVPREPARVIGTKTRSGAPEADLDAACRRLAARLEPDRLYVVGPGSTTHRVLEHAGIEGTLGGVDAVHNGQLVGRDLNEDVLLTLLKRNASASVIVSVIGGQGALFGRGNQQISAEVLRAVGPENVIVIASLEKLVALDPCRLHVDTGDPAVDRALSGYRRIHVGPGRTLVVPVKA
jgi:predicted polyphosphate/ATP-dependent NAD kinase